MIPGSLCYLQKHDSDSEISKNTRKVSKFISTFQDTVYHIVSLFLYSRNVHQFLTLDTQ